MEIEKLLQKYYGYTSFKKGQKEVLTSVFANQNTFAILPTASGKTLCYTLPGFYREGLVIVISPLIALMSDQVQRMNRIQKNSAITINSHQNKKEQYFLIQHLERYQFLILSPEMLQHRLLQEKLKTLSIQLFVVDEAHCISQWGFDFRPEYLQIPKFIRHFPTSQILALTATASDVVKQDILSFLFEKRTYQTIQLPVNRENIGLFTHICQNEQEKKSYLFQVLEKIGRNGVIYCNTRKKTEELYALLKNKGKNCSFYHGGLNSIERQKLQVQFQHDNIDIMIATKAFGMGIDKRNIRYVIHYELPSSLEDYVQEIGRCARDGKEGFALLLYACGDEHIYSHFFKAQQKNLIYVANCVLQKDKKEKESIVFDKLTLKKKQQEAMQHYLFQKSCLREKISSYFQDDSPVIPKKCCTFHGLTLDDYIPLDEDVKKERPQEKERSWQEKLKFLINS